EVIAGDVLHHPAAGSDSLAATVHRLNPEHVVARRTRQNAPAAGDIGGKHAADRGLTRSKAKHRPKIDRFEGKLLVVLGQHLRDRRPSKSDKHKLGRLVKGHPDQALGAEHCTILHQAPDLAFGAVAHHLERRARVGCLGNEIGKLLHRVRSVEANAHMPSHWTLFPSSGNTLPGLSRQSGSNAALICICWAMSASENCTRMSSRFSMPTPCSPVRQPPSSTHSLRISAPHISTRSS